jgi:hypothetical protein
LKVKKIRRRIKRRKIKRKRRIKKKRKKRNKFLTIQIDKVNTKKQLKNITP